LPLSPSEDDEEESESERRGRGVRRKKDTRLAIAEPSPWRLSS
jgi:hypothetical protein